MRKLILVALAVLCVIGFVWAEGSQETTDADYPERDIFVYIFSSQGGGTDAWTRHLAKLMEPELGVKMLMNNLPGANGGNGGQKVWNADHDGYTVLGASETAMFFGSNGVAPTAENWHFFIAGGSPGVIAVPADSPFTTVEEMVAAAKANPESVKISNSGTGKLWNIKAVQLEEGAGVRFKHVPYNGSGPALTALLSKEVDALSASAGEIAEYVRGGLMRPLIMTEAVSMNFEGFGEVRAGSKVYPKTAFGYENMFQWLGFMLPIDTPAERVKIFEAAFLKAVNDPRTKDFAEKQNARIIGLSGEKATTLAKNMQQVSWWIAQDLGLAKVSPESAGIPRP